MNSNDSDYKRAEQSLLTSVLQGNKDIANRAQLGPMVPIRLFQMVRMIALGSSLETMVGHGGRRALVYQSGQHLGLTLGTRVTPTSGKDLNEYLKIVRTLCLSLLVGQVVLEKADTAKNRLTLRVDECVSCAGMAGMTAPICDFEAGMVGGLVKAFVSIDKPHDVRAVETRCHAVGDATCGIDVEVLS